MLVDAALPATPQTLASDKQMDSDDDFNSIASSQDLELNDADSSVDFGAAGEHIVTWSRPNRMRDMFH